MPSKMRRLVEIVVDDENANIVQAIRRDWSEAGRR